jgi:hypothetical protein
MRFEILKTTGGVLGVFEADSVAGALGLAKVPWLMAGKPKVRVRSLESLNLHLWHQRGIDCHQSDYLPIDHDGRPLGELQAESILPAIERMYEDELAGLGEADRQRAMNAACIGYRGSHENHGGTVSDGERPSHLPPEPPPARYAHAA